MDAEAAVGDAFARSRALVPELVVRPSAGSTNAELASRARAEHLAPFTTIVTTDQTSGRGRLDRDWSAPAGSALAISVLLEPRGASGGPIGVDRYGWIAIAAGVAMSETVKAALPAASVGFKWPNDVLVQSPATGATERKICGILAELVADRGVVVLGAGVNTAMTAEQLPVPTATSLAIEGATDEAMAPDAVLADYLTRLRTLVEAFEHADGDADASGLRSRARALCLTLGRAVRVELPGGTTALGTAVDLDEAGRLVVRDEAGVELVVAAGDITHLRHG